MTFFEKIKHLGSIIAHAGELAEEHADEALRIIQTVGGILAVVVPPAAPVVAAVEVGAAATVKVIDAVGTTQVAANDVKPAVFPPAVGGAAAGK